MLIIDEVHKVKNIKQGVRSHAVQHLADSLAEQPDSYLVMLSATPVPNKVRDVAMLLRLLHPDRYANQTAQEIERAILDGDLTDIRAQLVSHMQRKRLEDIQTMPELHAGEEQVLPVSLNEHERAAYELILDDDELGANEKIQAMRTFLLNSHIEGS
jgi:hypothetical protein